MAIFYDGTAPTVTFNTQATADNNPELSGTIDDAAASVTVKIESNTYSL